MKVGALIFLLSPFIPLHHGIRFPLQNWVTPAWENSIPEIPQGPEVVLSLEMQLAVPGDEDGAAEIVANAEAEAELLPDEDHDDAAGDAVNRQNGFD